jgi:Holliday junction resolvase RusA-like endonuclease
MPFFIAGNVASSKNSKRIVSRGSFKRLINSKLAMEYASIAMPQLLAQKEKWLQVVENQPKPLYVGFYFIRKDRRKWDFHNIVQSIADLMVKAEWIADDNTEEFIPVYVGHKVDKEGAGVVINLVAKPEYLVANR